MDEGAGREMSLKKKKKKKRGTKSKGNSQRKEKVNKGRRRVTEQIGFRADMRRLGGQGREEE